MKKIFMSALLAIPMMAGSATLQGASAGDDGPSCYRLWYERNAIYKRFGYCFKTKRARQTFGNAGCYTSNPRLPGWARRKVQRIRRTERRWGC